MRDPMSPVVAAGKEAVRTYSTRTRLGVVARSHGPKKASTVDVEDG